MKLALLAALTAVSFVSFSHAETLADCGQAYDRCKRDVANMFDKRPCRKKRDACEQRVAAEQRNSTKNRMMNGIVEATPGDAMRRGQLTGREAAEQRLREREMRERGMGQGQPIAVGVGSGMREPVRQIGVGAGAPNPMRPPISGQPGVGVGVQPTQPIGVGSGMRNGYGSDPKAEAERRMREREQAKATPGNGMRENIKSN